MATENVLISFEVDYTELTNAQAELAKTGKIDDKGFQKIQAAINETATDTKGLIKTFKDVAGASVKMGKTVEDAFGAGIQDALDEAGVSLDEFQASLKKANQPAITLKKELQQLKEAMARMKAEGKDTGKEFDALRQRAGKLSDAIADANAEIKNAGSDTRGLDNVVGSISALAGGYAAVQGAAALFGDESEDLQKALLKVNGAMALASGLQQTLNALQKEGALTKLADSIATGAQTAATKLYTFVMAGATVATKAFRLALIATGIGAIIVLIVSLVSAMSSYGDETKEAKEAQDQLRTSVELMNESLDFQIARLKRLGEERLAQLESEGKTGAAISKERIKLINNEIELLKQKEANSRKLADSEKTGSEEAQRLYKEANDFFYQQEALKSQIKIIGFNDDKKRRDDEAKRNEGFNKKRLADLEKAKQKELADLAIKVKAQLAALDKEEEQLRVHFENEQEILERDRAEKEAVNKKWDDLRKEMQASFAQSSQIEIDKRKKDNQEQEDEIKRRAALIIDVGTRVASVYSQIAQLQTDRDMQIITSQRQVVEEQLRAGVITQKAALAKLARLDQATRDAQNRAAKREKQAAVFSAALAIPKAVLQGLSQGGPLLAAIYGALAAVEFALIASRPVPRFFRGKKDKYSGPGTVADMGSEIVERDGRMFLYTKPTQTYLGANDKVYTASETRNIMHNTNINTTVRQPVQERFNYDKFAAAIPAAGININIDKDGITEWTTNELSRTNYRTRRYSSRK